MNPRFVHLDKSTNLDEVLCSAPVRLLESLWLFEARKYNCFRFKDILAA